VTFLSFFFFSQAAARTPFPVEFETLGRWEEGTAGRHTVNGGGGNVAFGKGSWFIIAHHGRLEVLKPAR